MLTWTKRGLLVGSLPWEPHGKEDVTHTLELLITNELIFPKALSMLLLCAILHWNQSWERCFISSHAATCTVLRSRFYCHIWFHKHYAGLSSASHKLGSILQMAWEKQPQLSGAFVIITGHRGLPPPSPSIPPLPSPSRSAFILKGFQEPWLSPWLQPQNMC